MTGAEQSRRLVAWWAVLVLATCVSWASASGHGAGVDVSRVGVVVALAIAFVKVAAVGAQFMELRDAPRALQVVFNGWVVVVGLGLIGMYVLG